MTRERRRGGRGQENKQTIDSSGDIMPRPVPLVTREGGSGIAGRKFSSVYGRERTVTQRNEK